jgi:hypothetical protein
MSNFTPAGKGQVIPAHSVSGRAFLRRRLPLPTSSLRVGPTDDTSPQLATMRYDFLLPHLYTHASLTVVAWRRCTSVEKQRLKRSASTLGARPIVCRLGPFTADRNASKP